MNSHAHLFNGARWHDVAERQLREMTKAIQDMDADRLLNTSPQDLALYLQQCYDIDIPILVEDDVRVDQREIKIDVSQDRSRNIRDRSRPVYLLGTEVSYEVPFTGESEALHIRPTQCSMNPPRASIRSNILEFIVQGIDLKEDDVRTQFQHFKNEVNNHLAQLRKDVVWLRTELKSRPLYEIEARRAKLLANRNLVAGLGVKLKTRPGTSNTYTAPEVRRKILPTMPNASSVPYAPEPVLDEEHYKHILKVLQSTVTVMERSPHAFTTMKEEDIRQHLLVQLNGHYEGQAMAEAFNYEGKTDILVRINDRNIFIGECKFWGGPQVLKTTIDQLLRYSSWRDTKVALLVFNRNKQFSKVLEAIPKAVKEHPNYKSELEIVTSTEFRYRFAQKDDANRELTMTVLAFDIPSLENH